MREIKFRAWDKERKQMRYQNIEYFRIGLRHNKEGNEFWKDLNMSVDNFYTPEQGEFMQYTGLKDKNGKEIYEGDILDVKAGESGVFRYQVMWNEKQCGWRNQYGQKLPQLFGKPNSEVIGDIYENPELLTVGGKDDSKLH